MVSSRVQEPLSPDKVEDGFRVSFAETKHGKQGQEGKKKRGKIALPFKVISCLVGQEFGLTNFSNALGARLLSCRMAMSSYSICLWFSQEESMKHLRQTIAGAHWR